MKKVKEKHNKGLAGRSLNKGVQGRSQTGVPCKPHGVGEKSEFQDEVNCPRFHR